MLNEEELRETVKKIAESDNMPVELQNLIVHFALAIRSISLSLEKLDD